MQPGWRRLLLPGVWSLTLTVLVGHALAALSWWWAMPQGFGVGHTRFWLNAAMPLSVAVVTLGTLAVVRRTPLIVAWVLAAMGAAWGASGIAAWAVFPHTFGRGGFVAVAVGGGLLGLAAAHAWPPRRGWAVLAAALLVGVVPGIASVLAVRPPPASTRPHGAFEPAGPPLAVAGDGSVRLARGGVFVELNPLLTFISRSSDGGWTCFEPQASRLTARAANDDGWIDLGSVRGSDRVVGVFHTMRGSTSDDGITLDVRSDLTGYAASHLNTYATLFLTGLDEPAVSFSPCPDVRVAVTNSDYPVGRPARFAALLPGGRFVVVEATSAEKGPFEVLAEGTLRRGEPLTVTFHDGDAAVATWTMRDFSSQASVEPSPSAGWGMPQNAVRFTREAGGVSVYVSLAATGVGRGFDTVLHAPGTYRGRHEWAWVESETNNR